MKLSHLPFPVLLIFLFALIMPSLGHAAADLLQASADQDNIVVDMGKPTVIHVTLRNKSATLLYLTGVEVSLTDGASGDVYDPSLLAEKLRALAPGQTWDGPLIVVKPKQRGPLLVKGTIFVKGGTSSDIKDQIAVVPLQLTINDPRRELDGSYDEEAVPLCDRTLDHCCDPSEASCFQRGPRCIYIAEGYNRQQVCVNQQSEKSYERIMDLHVSSDALHMAYLAMTKCLTDGENELCQRTVVLDNQELPTMNGIPTHLELSSDGQHYAYIGRASCLIHAREEHCAGASRFIVDGAKASALPPWYSRS